MEMPKTAKKVTLLLLLMKKTPKQPYKIKEMFVRCSSLSMCLFNSFSSLFLLTRNILFSSQPRLLGSLMPSWKRVNGDDSCAQSFPNQNPERPCPLLKQLRERSGKEILLFKGVTWKLETETCPAPKAVSNPLLACAVMIAVSDKWGER